MSSLAGGGQEAGENTRGTTASQQGSANLSVPSSPLLDFDAAELVRHYQAGEYEHMAVQFLTVLTHLRDTTCYQIEEASHLTE